MTVAVGIARSVAPGGELASRLIEAHGRPLDGAIYAVVRSGGEAA